MTILAGKPGDAHAWLDWRSAIAATVPTPPFDETDLRCAYHPDTPTRLRCGKCGKPVCPKCVVSTAVGQRCRDCARARPSVVYETDTVTLARALAAGLVAALLLGVAWGFGNRAGLTPRVTYDWGFWFALLTGFGVAEAVSWGARRKRGSALQALGIGGVLLAVIVSRAVINARALRPLTLDVVLSRPLDALNFLGLDLTHLLFIALACWIAYLRFR